MLNGRYGRSQPTCSKPNPTRAYCTVRPLPFLVVFAQSVNLLRSYSGGYDADRLPGPALFRHAVQAGTDEQIRG